LGALVSIQAWASVKLAVNKAVEATSRIRKVFIGRLMNLLHSTILWNHCQVSYFFMDCRGRISIFKQPFGSEGTIENSPAFQCRDRLGKSRVPQGRLKRSVFSGVPAGLVVIPSNPGVQTPGYFQNVPLGHSVSVVQKLRCARLPVSGCSR
jgi:hypothetical protein